MGYISSECPNCGGKVQLNDKEKTTICIFCGSPIKYEEAMKNVQIEGKVNVSGVAGVKNLITLIERDLENGRNKTNEFRDRLNRALELDPSNSRLYSLQLSEIWNADIRNGVLFSYNTNSRKLIIPDGVKEIAPGALKDNSNMVELIVPDSVVRIGINQNISNKNNLKIYTKSGTCPERFAIVQSINLIYDDQNHDSVFLEKANRMKSLISDIRRDFATKEKNIRSFYDPQISRYTLTKQIQTYDEKKVPQIGFISSAGKGCILSFFIFLINVVISIIILPFFIWRVISFFAERKRYRYYRKRATAEISMNTAIKHFSELRARKMDELNIKDEKYINGFWNYSEENIGKVIRMLEEEYAKIRHIGIDNYISNEYMKSIQRANNI